MSFLTPSRIQTDTDEKNSAPRVSALWNTTSIRRSSFEFLHTSLFQKKCSQHTRSVLWAVMNCSCTRNEIPTQRVGKPHRNWWNHYNSNTSLESNISSAKNLGWSLFHAAQVNDEEWAFMSLCLILFHSEKLSHSVESQQVPRSPCYLAGSRASGEFVLASLVTFASSVTTRANTLLLLLFSAS